MISLRLRHLEAVPTWCLVNMAILFVPSTHIWFNRWFPLAVWCEGRTYFTRQVDIMLWMFFITLELCWVIERVFGYVNAN